MSITIPRVTLLWVISTNRGLNWPSSVSYGGRNR